MEDVDKIRIAIVSDLHFIPEDKGSDVSWLSFDREGKLQDSLWPSLLECINDNQITADLLLCPGDITTHSNKDGLIKAWESLSILGNALECQLLATATGNHDVQSRPISIGANVIRDLNTPNDFLENLKLLTPPYPLVDYSNDSYTEAHQRRVCYFGSDYLIFDEHDDYRVVIFNSCARHTQSPEDYERGRIAESTLGWLEEELEIISKKNRPKVNILICHHHPIQHDSQNLGAYDFMHNGSRLMSLLAKYGHWLVVHGHKHHAMLSYSGGARTQQIPVFSAGTLAAHKRTLGTGFNNQFYIIDINKKPTVDGLKGQVRAWSWAGNRWIESKSRKDGVYSGVGFGFQGLMSDLLKSIDTVVPKAVPISWLEVVNRVENLKYLMPEDLNKLRSILSTSNIDMNYDSDGCLIGLSRAAES